MSNGESRLIASIAAHESWANTVDRSLRTAAARAALMAKFENEVDPNRELPPNERALRAEHKRRAYFQRLALKSAQSRRKARELTEAAEAAEADLSKVGGAA